MNQEEILAKISDLYHSKFDHPFPYEDTNQIKADFEGEITILEDEGLNADFNDYCTVIIGAAIYFKRQDYKHPEKANRFLACGLFPTISPI